MKYRLLRTFRTVSVFSMLLSMMACQTTIPSTSSENRNIANETALSGGSLQAAGIGGGKSSCPPGWFESLPGSCSNYHAGGKVCAPKFVLTVFSIPGTIIIENVACCPASSKPETIDDCVTVILCQTPFQPRFVELPNGETDIFCCPPTDAHGESCVGPGKTPRPRGG